MLLGIPRIINAELLTVLMKMGHGDEIVIADGNFPAYRIAQKTVYGKPIEITGEGMIETVKGILKLMPLDEAVACPAGYMDKYEGMEEQPIHRAFSEVLARAACPDERIEKISRFDFYERAMNAYAIIITSETARFGNALLKKGVVKL